MRITFLGSGGAFCDFRVNYQNNAVVHTEEGPVLLDCGITALQSLKELGIGAHDIRGVLITHLHADHASPAVLVGERFYKSPGGPERELSADADPGPRRRHRAPHGEPRALPRRVPGPLGGDPGRWHRAMVDARTVTETEIGGTRFPLLPRAPRRRGGRRQAGVRGGDQRRPPQGRVERRHHVLPDWIQRTASSVDLCSTNARSCRAKRRRCTRTGRSSRAYREIRRRIVLMHTPRCPRGRRLVGACSRRATRHFEPLNGSELSVSGVVKNGVVRGFDVGLTESHLTVARP
jgi:hypothetical protein